MKFDSVDITDKHIDLFASLFKGRTDVYARRWDANNKSGYSPAYNIDWSFYDLHKAAGGTLKDYPHKAFAVLNAECIVKHLQGTEVIGIYPLLTNNSSWFFAIDFDEGNWKEDSLSCYNQCLDLGIETYIERSRSGTGAHIWAFFEEEYPAFRTRKIAQFVLQKAGINKTKNHNSSFDRIFPNQDQHSGKGLGNLIALPLQKDAVLHGNSCFIDPQTYEAFHDQWLFLTSVKRNSKVHLDSLLKLIGDTAHVPMYTGLSNTVKNDPFQITLKNVIILEKDKVPSKVLLFLRKNLSVTDPRFYIKKATGKSTFGTAASKSFLAENGNQIVIPRGFIGQLLRFCKSNGINYTFIDERHKLPEIEFDTLGLLYDFQMPVLDISAKRDFGVIVAPPGTGKTNIALFIIAQKKQPSLIIVNRKQLFDQWIERIEAVLDIPRFNIGRITSKQTVVGEKITVAMVQSLSNENIIQLVDQAFGTIIIDECHHTPSDTYIEILAKLNTYYLYGLTATPIRKNKDERLIFNQIGELLYEVQLSGNDKKKRKVILNIRDTDFNVPFTEKEVNFELLSNMLVHNHERNSLIVNDILTELRNRSFIIVITERKAHVEILDQYLKSHCDTVTISGDDSESSRHSKLHQLKKGEFQVLITTGQYFGEGVDIEILECLFIVYPVSFEGKLIQYIGRVQRGENQAIIYDYRDLYNPLFEKMFHKRNKYYSSLGRNGLLKDREESYLLFEEDRFYIDHAVNAYPISILDIDLKIERFKPGVVWKIRVIKINEGAGTMSVEIIDYDSKMPANPGQKTLSFLSLVHIRFISLDTGRLLKSVILEKSRITATGLQYGSQLIKSEPTYTISKVINVPFKEVAFGAGHVKIAHYLTDLKRTIFIEIPNENIRSEFEAVKDYFSRLLKAKYVKIDLTIKHNGIEMLSCNAASNEIDAINENVIGGMRFEFVKKKFLKYKPENDEKTIHTLESFASSSTENRQSIIGSAEVLLNEVLKIDSAKHFLQLKYLAPRHESNILKLRFVLQPFSFIFLLAGRLKYYVIWETLDTEEATYVWQIDKSKDILLSALNELEMVFKEMKQSGRNEYLKKAPENFIRIMHDYSDPKGGFINWKAELEQRME